MPVKLACSATISVALLAEGVGRNPDFPSMWQYLPRVAHHAEGVDKNTEIFGIVEDQLGGLNLR